MNFPELRVFVSTTSKSVVELLCSGLLYGLDGIRTLSYHDDRHCFSYKESEEEIDAQSYKF